MLVQPRADHLRIFTQHDHGLLSGDMAARWTNVQLGARPGADMILAASLHDAPWRHADQHVSWNPDTRRPHDFISHPREARLALYRLGLDELESLSRHAALLTSRHYVRLLGARVPNDFLAHETARQARLALSLGVSLDSPTLQAQQRLLSLLDNISLFVCMTTPGSDPSTHPVWLGPRAFIYDDQGRALRLTWRDEHTLHIDPSPFDAPQRFEIPCRRLEGLRFDDDQALQGAWRLATPQRYALNVISD